LGIGGVLEDLEELELRPGLRVAQVDGVMPFHEGQAAPIGTPAHPDHGRAVPAQHAWGSRATRIVEQHLLIIPGADQLGTIGTPGDIVYVADLHIQARREAQSA